MKKPKQASAGNWSKLVFLFVTAFVGILSALFIPWGAWALSSHPHPVVSYAQATTEIDALRAARESEMNPDCRLQFLTHGQKVRNVIILVHGYTNCPAQFGELGGRFYEL